MATLTRWLLRQFADNWPGGLPTDADPGGPLFLADRDDSAVLDVDTTTDPTTLTRDRPSGDFESAAGQLLSVALTDDPQLPAGLGGREYRAEPVLSVRIEGPSVYESDNGIEHSEEFMTELVRVSQDIIRELDNGDLQAAPVANFYIAEPANQRPQMDGYAEWYSYQYEVQPRGYRTV